MRSSPYKKCPRCNEKCFINEKACHECGLIFERLNYTSNKTAKKLILRGNFKDTIKTKNWPYDVSKIKALILCGFLGLTGAHNFYLGRFLKAGLMLFGLLFSVVMVLLTEYIYGTGTWYILLSIVIIPGCASLIFWFTDFIAILFERYKIPVAINEDLYKIKEHILDKQNNNDSEKNNKNKLSKKNKTKDDINAKINVKISDGECKDNEIINKKNNKKIKNKK